MMRIRDERPPTAAIREIVCEVRDLTVRDSASNRILLDRVNLTLPAATVTAIVGASGSGKSLLLRSILGRLPAGTTLCSDHTSAVRMQDGTRVMIALQDAFGSFHPARTLGAHLNEVVRAQGGDLSDRRWMSELLREAGLEGRQDLLKRRVGEASGGELQRFNLACALSVDPDLLLADEITTALDPATAEIVMSSLSSQAARRGRAVAFVTHDIALARRWSDHVIVIDHGRIVEYGETGTVLAMPGSERAKALVAGYEAATRPRDLNVSIVARPRSSHVMLDAQRLSYRRGSVDAGKPVIDELSVTVRGAESIGIIGHSGAGKTTLLMLLAALLVPSSGVVHWGETPVAAPLLGRARRLRRHLQIVQQHPGPSFDPRWTVEQTVGEPLRALRVAGERSRLVGEALERVNLSADFAPRNVASLSGGEQQRVAIARAIATRPRVLLCDEPLASVDAEQRPVLAHMLRSTCRQDGTALITVTHDIRLLPLLADTVLRLDGGQLRPVESAELAELEPDAAPPPRGS